MRRFRFRSIILLLIAGIGFVVPAFAYSSHTVGKEGKTLRWSKSEIEIAISDSFYAPDVDESIRENVKEVIRKSFEAWSREADVKFVFRRSPKTNVSNSSSSGDGVSLITIAPTAENLLIFGEHKTNVSAVTRLFYDDNGNISEADIVLNPTARFTSDGSRGSFDFQSTVTHEVGHLLGLGHSFVVGSTMHTHQGRNGVFGLPATFARTLAEDDKAGVRHLYGASRSDAREFGSLEITMPEKTGFGSEIWIEDESTGSLVAGISSNESSKVVFASLPVGVYRISGHDKVQNKQFELANTVTISSSETSLAELHLSEKVNSKKIRAFGFNGQIAGLPIPVESGRSYTLYFESNGLRRDSLKIESLSESISVDEASITYLYSNNGQDVFSFEVSVNDNTAHGDYTLRIFEENKYIGGSPGVITVDDVQNQWYNAISPVNTRSGNAKRLRLQ